VHRNILAAEGWIELGNYDEAAESFVFVIKLHVAS
jgi:hypothetical protein